MRTLIVTVILVLMVGCATDEADLATAQWIKAAKKPVVCRQAVLQGLTNTMQWTLIDADGNVYQSGWSRLALPDTIKVMGEQK